MRNFLFWHLLRFHSPLFRYKLLTSQISLSRSELTN